jgi:parvulin-like peptidyl-prolyl isomerase
MFSNPHLQKSGGDLGQCYFGELEPALENVAFALKPGQLYDNVVKSSFGYHVIQAEEITIRYIPSKENFGLYKEEVERV